MSVVRMTTRGVAKLFGNFEMTTRVTCSPLNADQSVSLGKRSSVLDAEVQTIVCSGIDGSVVDSKPIAQK